jgi:predicted GIY-YIG superfamily endonuclease
MKEIKRHQGQQFKRFQDDEGNLYSECKNCKEIKPETLEFFYKQKTTKSGLRSICKSCCDEYHMNRYKNEEGFRERVSELHREWSRNNSDKVRENSRKSRKRALENDLEGVRKLSRRVLKSWKASHPAGIYKITCVENSRVYIGESKCMRHRWTSHKSALRKTKGRTNDLLQEDWDKFGEKSFVFEIIEELPKNKDILLQREYEYINAAIKEGLELYNNAACIKDREKHKKQKDNSPSCVYKIKCTENSKVYIGQTMDWARRKKSHVSQLRRGGHTNTLLQEDWNNHGEDCFEFTVLKKNNSQDFLIMMEKQIINQLITEGVYLYNRGELTLEQINSLNKTED